MNSLSRQINPFVVFLGAVLVFQPAALQAQNSCPVTRPQNPAFVPPRTITGGGANGVYVGTNDLWVFVPPSWTGLPLWDTGYRNKIFWWIKDYQWRVDPNPDLEITGRRLDAPAPPLIVTGANGSYRDDMGSFIVSGVNFPTAGCWEISGKYRGATVSFVVEVR